LNKGHHHVLTSLRQSLRNIAAYALDFFLPRLCVFCGEAVELAANTAVCPACDGLIERVASPKCPCCGRRFPGQDGADHLCGPCATELPPFAAARAAVIYGEDGLTGQAIKGLKYARRLEYLPVLQSWLQEPHCREVAHGAEVIVPVPLHPRRLRERGFNQALLLAQALPGDLLRSTLVRTRYTKPQTGLDPRARRENVHGAFAVTRPRDIRGKTVLLVDDVYTTGATVGECARTLLAAGAQKLLVLTVARVGPR
jgi:ComF family protein